VRALAWDFKHDVTRLRKIEGYSLMLFDALGADFERSIEDNCLLYLSRLVLKKTNRPFLAAVCR